MIPGPHHLSLSQGRVCELIRYLHKNEHIITYSSTTYHDRAGPAWWDGRTDDVSLCAVLPYAARARGGVEGQVPLCRKVAALHKLLRSGERLCKHHAYSPPGRTFCHPVSACFSRLPRGRLVLLAHASASQSTYQYSTVSLTMQYRIMLLVLCSPSGGWTEASSRAKARPSSLVVLAIGLKPDR
jgi:hypothetical protein